MLTVLILVYLIVPSTRAAVLSVSRTLIALTPTRPTVVSLGEVQTQLELFATSVPTCAYLPLLTLVVPLIRIVLSLASQLVRAHKVLVFLACSISTVKHQHRLATQDVKRALLVPRTSTALLVRRVLVATVRTPLVLL